MSEPSCANCRHYLAPKPTPDGVDPVRTGTAHVYLYGRCRRYPTQVSCEPDHWCGEFSQKAE